MVRSREIFGCPKRHARQKISRLALNSLRLAARSARNDTGRQPLTTHHIMAVKTLRIFISSPGDVGQERLIATRVIERLQGEFAAFIKLEPILWEHEPLRASSHFQEQIVPPSQTDIVVCILWSRLGTRLPGQFHREDGSLYQSGTEWEFEDALRSFRERGAPDLMVYRKIAESHASMSDEQALMQRLEQKKALDAFIDHWFGNPQDAFRAAFHAFDSPDKFEELLEAHLHRLVAERLPQRITDGGEAMAPIVWHKGSPFRGLEAFDVDHAAVFFGRTQAIGEHQGGARGPGAAGSCLCADAGHERQRQVEPGTGRGAAHHHAPRHHRRHWHLALGHFSPQ